MHEKDNWSVKTIPTWTNPLKIFSIQQNFNNFKHFQYVCWQNKQGKRNRCKNKIVLRENILSIETVPFNRIKLRRVYMYDTGATVFKGPTNSAFSPYSLLHSAHTQFNYRERKWVQNKLEMQLHTFLSSAEWPGLSLWGGCSARQGGTSRPGPGWSVR